MAIWSSASRGPAIAKWPFPFTPEEEDAAAGDDTLGVVDCPRIEGRGGLTMAFHGVLNTYIFRVAPALLYKSLEREIGRKCKHSVISNRPLFVLGHSFDVHS